MQDPCRAFLKEVAGVFAEGTRMIPGALGVLEEILGYLEEVLGVLEEAIGIV